MANDYNLQFIERKLNEVRTAVMYTEGNNVVKLPNDIVTFIKVDDAGKLWFTARKPNCELVQYDQCFPLRLFFYRKGIGYYIEANGVANIAGKDDTEEMKHELPEGTYLVKMTPHLVEYTEIGRKPVIHGWTELWTSVSKWFMDNLSFIHIKHARLSGVQKTKNYG
jgi:hypothetical protein